MLDEHCQPNTIVTMKRPMMSISPSKVQVKFSILEDFDRLWWFSGMAVFLEVYRRTVMMSWRSSVQFMISGQLICFQGRYFTTFPTNTKQIY